MRRIGAYVDYDAGKQAVVLTAIPDAANHAFSKRDREILRHAKRFTADQGLDWDDLSADRKLEIVEEASAAGKLGKMKSDERRIWRQQAEALGWSHSSVMERAAHEPLTDAERFDRAYACLLYTSRCV